MLVLSFLWSEIYSSMPYLLDSGITNLVYSITSLYLKSSWPSHIASISMIRLDIETSLYMLRLGYIVLASDFNLNISDYLLICRKK